MVRPPAQNCGRRAEQGGIIRSAGPIDFEGENLFLPRVNERGAGRPASPPRVNQPEQQWQQETAALRRGRIDLGRNVHRKEFLDRRIPVEAEKKSATGFQRKSLFRRFVELTREPPTVKQHLAAVRMLFDWLGIDQVVEVNPASSVRGPKHVVKCGKTPVLKSDEARLLLDSIKTDDCRPSRSSSHRTYVLHLRESLGDGPHAGRRLLPKRQALVDSTA